MDRRHRKRILLGQNFLRDGRLVERLVRSSSISRADIVYEIGPGNGIITAVLARCAGKVIAVERDPALVNRLRTRFAERSNVAIVECDFLKYRIRETGDFKIFGNVPFGITADLMRKLIDERPIASEMFLVLQKEAAWKYSGMRGETLVSLLAKPRFQFEIVHRFRRTDFEPVPDVDSVMLRITHRRRRLIERCDEPVYRDFVRRGFCAWRPNLRLAFKHDFSYKRWKHLSRELKFPINAKPSELTFEQWLGLFNAFRPTRM
jgi:23S rRNA (adenine-N6)-dimethyltransferase